MKNLINYLDNIIDIEESIGETFDKNPQKSLKRKTRFKEDINEEKYNKKQKYR